MNLTERRQLLLQILAICLLVTTTLHRIRSCEMTLNHFSLARARLAARLKGIALSLCDDVHLGCFRAGRHVHSDAQLSESPSSDGSRLAPFSVADLGGRFSLLRQSRSRIQSLLQQQQHRLLLALATQAICPSSTRPSFTRTGQQLPIPHINLPLPTLPRSTHLIPGYAGCRFSSQPADGNASRQFDTAGSHTT